MGCFRTEEGRCVVEHGEIRLESFGVGGRLKRRYRNARRQRKRSLLRFGFGFVMTAYTLGQLLYRWLFGDRWLAVLWVGIVVAVVAVAYGFVFVRNAIGRRFQGFTDERTIPLRAVESVDPHPKKPLRRPYFVIRYDEYGDGNEKKRRVRVCTRTPLAEEEFETAKAVLLDECDLPITPA